MDGIDVDVRQHFGNDNRMSKNEAGPCFIVFTGSTYEGQFHECSGVEGGEQEEGSALVMWPSCKQAPSTDHFEHFTQREGWKLFLAGKKTSLFS